MTWFLVIMAILFTSTFNEVQRGREPSPRYWQVEKDTVQNERRRYEEEERGDVRVGDGKPIEQGEEIEEGTGY